MSSSFDASPSRFRTGSVVQPTTPQERLRALLDDGPGMYALYEELLREAARAQEWTLVVELARIAADATDRFRAHAAQRLAASLLLVASASLGRDATWGWAAPLDLTVDLLVPVLDAQPHEPELLVQLGTAVCELGDVNLARRCLEAVRVMEPEHVEAGRWLEACSERLASTTPILTVPATHAPALAREGASITSITERASRVEPRTISLCMIVKDEEEMLPGCLAAAAPWVDEIIVVDTGSTDRTRDIALEHGAKVVEFAWNGSFSDARNESLRHATSDWILWLDADEHLVDGDGAQLHELARQTWVEGFTIVETHFLGDGDEQGGEASHAPMRLFRRRPGYEWRGMVHEQVAWALPSWLPGRVRASTVRVNHFGYLARVVSDRSKGTRNLDLLMQQVQQERTAFTCFNIGSEHAAAGSWLEARDWFEQALQIARADGDLQDQQFTPLLVQRAAAARRVTGDGDGAIDLADEALAWWPEYTDLVFEQARAHADAERWDDVERCTRDALELGDAPARFVSVSGKGSFQARMLLAHALRRLERIDEARGELERTIGEAPRFLAAIVEFTELLLERGDDPEIVSTTVDELLGDRASSITTNVLLGTTFHDCGAFDVADERYARVLDQRPDHGIALVARSELRLAQGRLHDAWTDGLAVDELDPIAPAGARSAFLAGAALQQLDLVAPAGDRIAHSRALPAAERAVYVAWRQLHEPGEPITTLIPIEPAAASTLFRNLEALARLEAVEEYELLHGLAVQVVPDERERHLRLADLYLRLRFADLAAEELLTLVDLQGADPVILTSLGKVATLKELWEDAEVFLTESLSMDPRQPEAERLLAAVQVRARIAG